MGKICVLSHDVDLVLEYNGDISQIRLEDNDIDYVIPREGGVYWEDCLAIPIDAPPSYERS